MCRGGAEEVQRRCERRCRGGAEAASRGVAHLIDLLLGARLTDRLHQVLLGDDPVRVAIEHTRGVFEELLEMVYNAVEVAGAGRHPTPATG